MNVDPAHLVGTGGALGALCRTLVGEYVDVEEVPASTFLVNVLGTFVLALATFAGLGGDVLFFVGTGFCGAFTTFSSFSVETVRLWETGERALAAVTAAGNLVGAGVAIALAWALVTGLGL